MRHTISPAWPPYSYDSTGQWVLGVGIGILGLKEDDTKLNYWAYILLTWVYTDRPLSLARDVCIEPRLPIFNAYLKDPAKLPVVRNGRLVGYV